MKHESLTIKKFTIREEAAFRVRVESWEVASPKGLYSVDFIQECLNKDGEVDFTSTYNFHMTKEDISELCKGLLAV